MLSVVSSPVCLTVEAHGVGVEEVLREMGKRMGFTVVIKEAVRPVVNVLIKDATPEEALQQILRGESYALVYRDAKGKLAQGSGGIAKVLLLSPSGPMAANRPAELNRLEQERRQALFQSQAAATDSSEAAQTTRAFSQEERTHIIERADAIARGGPVTISDLLEDQALQALLPETGRDASSDSEQSSAGEDVETTDAEPTSGTVNLTELGADEQRRMQESLTMATQLAQRNLIVLFEGLAAATNSLFNLQANQGEGGR
jgi:hypothetical protein